MNPKQLLKHAGIAVTVSSIDVPTFRQIDNINVRAERFIRLQNALISTPQTDQSAVGAHLVAFELADPLAFASMEQLDHCNCVRHCLGIWYAPCNIEAVSAESTNEALHVPVPRVAYPSSIQLD
jgi:hypothetical protein